ncbi:MAG: hypothetical protein JXB24_03945 [Bacteroidales bacterium]|nr:hypothetical protein [Bacteroidales bacterium]
MKHTRMIETYLDGKLNKEGSEKIKVLMNKNKEFSAEVNLHNDINESVKDDQIFELRNNIITLLNKKDTETTSGEKANFMKYMKYPVAAAILLLIGFSLFQILSFKSPEEIFHLYYNPYQTDITTRSVINSTDKIQLSYILYQEGNYEVSFEILKKYLEKNTADQAARFYYSMNAIELDKNDLAISELLIILEDSFTPYSLHARWYLAMLYLKTGEVEKSRKYLHLLANEENIYTKRSKTILKKLK